VGEYFYSLPGCGTIIEGTSGATRRSSRVGDAVSEGSMYSTGMIAPVLAADFSILLAWLSLAGALLVGAMIIMAVQYWLRRRDSRKLSPSDELSHYRSLYEQGIISKEEFDQLRSVLGGELLRSLPVSRGEAPGGAIQPPPPPAGPSPPGAQEPPPTDTGIRPG
jgi:hypothetical protein